MQCLKDGPVFQKIYQLGYAVKSDDTIRDFIKEDRISADNEENAAEYLDELEEIICFFNDKKTFHNAANNNKYTKNQV